MSTPHFPGWYPDPDQPGRERLWDGQAWTRHLRKAAGTVRLSPRTIALAVGSGLLGLLVLIGGLAAAGSDRGVTGTAPRRLRQAVNQRSRHPVHQRRARNWRGFRLLRGLVWPKRSASCVPQALRWARLIADRPARERAPF